MLKLCISTNHFTCNNKKHCKTRLADQQLALSNFLHYFCSQSCTKEPHTKELSCNNCCEQAAINRVLNLHVFFSHLCDTTFEKHSSYRLSQDEQWDNYKVKDLLKFVFFFFFFQNQSNKIWSKTTEWCRDAVYVILFTIISIVVV